MKNEGSISSHSDRGGVRGLLDGSVRSIAVAVLLVLCSGIVFAQTTTSTIEGTVRDANGALVAGAQVKAVSSTLATERNVVTDAEGFYRIVSLPAGSYTLTVSQTGFANNVSRIELSLNRTATVDFSLQVGAVGGDVVNVASDLPLLVTDSPATGTTVTPQQIRDLPVTGREYLDLLQLVPGVAVNRQSSGDNANPVLGERSGNNNFFIDGQPNKDTVAGGPAAQFNQETIAEFQVLTTGYKAEFGQASGAIVNVITKSGTNAYRGVASLFHRNEAFDADKGGLRRFNYSLAGGGPIWKEKIFFFGSSERITENRASIYRFPTFPNDPASTQLFQQILDQENPLDGPAAYREIRNFLKLNQSFGRHQLVQEVNYTNELNRRVGSGIPSSRRNTGARRLLLGFGDTILVGDRSDPWIVTLRGGYRGEPSENAPATGDIAGLTTLNSFAAQQTCPPICGFFTRPTDPPSIQFGSATTASNLDQKYTSLSASANKLLGDHDIKFGWQFIRTNVDGLDSQTLTNQVFTTVNDYLNFGPVTSGIFLLLESGPPTPDAAQIRLRNNYNGLYFQDDWKILDNLNLSLGLRWDHDSEFSSNKNFSPRLGVAWSVTPKTVIRSHFGKFFDQFRLGLVSQVPEFGGSDRRSIQSLYFPRGFYGSPSLVSMLAFAVGLPGPCLSNQLTDAQITSGGLTCPLAPGVPLVGVDRLNRVVAAGQSPIPANTVITISNVQSLTGLTPDQYLAQAAASIGQPTGYFTWGQFGLLNNPIIPAATTPVAVDSTFETPHTLSFSVGVQQQLTSDMVVEVDYYHREMKNILGVRLSNLAFRSRVAGIGRSFDPPGSPELPTFGPYFEGEYDALVIAFNKRFGNRYQIGSNYTYAKATDNTLGINNRPTDQFVGIVPVVTEPCPASNPGCTPQTNANGSFVSRNGNFVAQAGTFSNGPDLDKGPSDLALDHIFQINGLVNLPWDFQLSGIFRAQSGFHFSQFDELNRDPDGNGNFNGIDFTAGRNAFTAPPYVTLDMRASKSFEIRERFKIQVLFEFFNLLNRQNPATVYNRVNRPTEPFGQTFQRLARREGQVGLRIEF
jgi:hypothetical protein